MIDLSKLRLSDKELLCWAPLSEFVTNIEYKEIQLSSCRDLIANIKHFPLVIRRENSANWEKVIKLGNHLYLYTPELKRFLDSNVTKLSNKLKSMHFAIYKDPDLRRGQYNVYSNRYPEFILIGELDTEIPGTTDNKNVPDTVKLIIEISLIRSFSSSGNSSYYIIKHGKEISYDYEYVHKSRIKMDLEAKQTFDTLRTKLINLIDSFRDKELSEQDITNLVNSILNIKNNEIGSYIDKTAEIIESLSLSLHDLFEEAYNDE